MEILHVSAECYPVAKAGGLGDVVGALPKYQRSLGHIAKVVMPMYRTKFLNENQWEVVHKGYTHLHDYWFNYTVIKEATNKLGFDLYLVDIYGLLDREKIYGYSDDTERFFAFQIAVTDWLNAWAHIRRTSSMSMIIIPRLSRSCSNIALPTANSRTSAPC